MGLLTFLKQSKDARKVFGKRELKIIEKQLLGINLTQSEKNRLSRDIRRKLEFIAKIARFEDGFKIKKGAEIKRRIEEAKDVILDDSLRKTIKAVVLYGSAAENKLSFSSDIDIAVEFEISLKEATQFRKRVMGRVSQRIDVQVYNYLPAKVQKEIQAKGRVLHTK